MTKQIDVLEHVRRSKLVKEGMRLLHDTYEGGEKAPAEYYRALLVLSYQFTDLGSLEDTMKILELLPASYFREVLPVQAEDDPALRKLAVQTAEALVAEGYASQPNCVLEDPVQLLRGES